MQLRMEILKLKKALFMKMDPCRDIKCPAQVLASLENDHKEISTLSSNYQEPVEELPTRRYVPYESSLRTPLSKVMTEDICEEEAIAFHSHEISTLRDPKSATLAQPAKLG